MKILKYTLFLVLMSSCQFKLHNKMFYASPVIPGPSALTTAAKLEFVPDTYKIHLLRGFYDTSGVVIEKGNYMIKRNNVTTTLECKLICEASIMNPVDQVPCGSFGTYYENGYFICSDTISEEKIKRLDFQKHEFIVSRKNGKLMLTSKSHPHWNLHEM